MLDRAYISSKDQFYFDKTIQYLLSKRLASHMEGTRPFYGRIKRVLKLHFNLMAAV